jgi:hypothetical protein
MSCHYEKRISFRDARAMRYRDDAPASPEELADRIPENGVLDYTPTDNGAGPSQRMGYSVRGGETGEQDGTGTFITLPDDGIPPLNGGGGKTRVGSFPPGNYVTATTSSGFHVYRMDPPQPRAILGTTFGDRATSPGARQGRADAAAVRKTADKIAAINRANTAFFAKQGG